MMPPRGAASVLSGRTGTTPGVTVVLPSAEPSRCKDAALIEPSPAGSALREFSFASCVEPSMPCFWRGSSLLDFLPLSTRPLYPIGASNSCLGAAVSPASTTGLPRSKSASYRGSFGRSCRLPCCRDAPLPRGVTASALPLPRPRPLLPGPLAPLSVAVRARPSSSWFAVLRSLWVGGGGARLPMDMSPPRMGLPCGSSR